jgi:hypothetical protein
VLDIPDQLGGWMPEADLLKLHGQPFLLAVRPGTPAASNDRTPAPAVRQPVRCS